MLEFANNITKAASTMEPLTLAIFFFGLISLGLIWLAALAIKSNSRGKK